MDGIVLLSPIILFTYHSTRVVAMDHVRVRFECGRWRFLNHSSKTVARAIYNLLNCKNFWIEFNWSEIKLSPVESQCYEVSLLFMREAEDDKRSYRKNSKRALNLPSVECCAIIAFIVSAVPVGQISERARSILQTTIPDDVMLKGESNCLSPREVRVTEIALSGEQNEYFVEVVWSKVLDDILSMSFPMFPAGDAEWFLTHSKRINQHPDFIMYMINGQLSIRYKELLTSIKRYNQDEVECSALHALLAKRVMDLVCIIDKKQKQKKNRIVCSPVEHPVGAVW